jgi:excisionase family DNA binding protein
MVLLVSIFSIIINKIVSQQAMEYLNMSTVLEPITAENEQLAIEVFGRALSAVRPHAKLVGPDGKEIPVPESIYKVLEQVIPLLASDQAISIVPIGHLLTTQEAAELLNVSRPFLIKLLDQETIPFERPEGPGSHRRIKFEDLMEYKHKRSAERREQLKRLTKLSQEAGFYEN